MFDIGLARVTGHFALGDHCQDFVSGHRGLVDCSYQLALRIFLSPGHQIHLEEWVNSPIWEGSDIRLRSGMAFQVDVIPATGTDYFTTNIEDGIALADHELRTEFERRFPDAWTRIVARRQFMKDSLRIDLHPDVLPFSNIPAYLPPFLLSPGHAMTFA